MWKYRTSSSDRYHILKEYARENRKNPTFAELVIWNFLRDGAIGTKVLRQYVIGDFIVDFFIPYYDLVIEIDGGYHAERSQQESDNARSDILNSMGLYVMRFKNEEVIADPDGSISRITELIKRIQK